jgi:hypothetical protein
MIRIKPLNIYKPAIKASFEVILTFEEHHYALCRTSFYDEDGVCINSQETLLTKDELDSWGEDDNYLYTLVLAKNGVDLS